MDREKALEILRRTEVFTPNELEMIMRVASNDAINDMDILCTSPRGQVFNHLEYAKKFVQEDRAEFFWRGYFGEYKHNEELLKEPEAVYWDRLRNARAYQEMGDKSFEFLQKRFKSENLAA